MSQLINKISQKTNTNFIICFLGGYMRKVELRMKELDKYTVIKDLVDHNGNKKRAAKRLGLSVRQINRLIKKYKENGKARLCAWKSL